MTPYGSCPTCGCARSECECRDRAKQVQVMELKNPRRVGAEDFMGFDELAVASGALLARLRA